MPCRLLTRYQVALEKFTRTGRRPVRAGRRAQALLALATGIGQQTAGQAVGLSRQAVSKVRRRYEATGWPRPRVAAGHPTLTARSEPP